MVKNDDMKENHTKGSLGNLAYWVPNGLVSGQKENSTGIGSNSYTNFKVRRNASKSCLPTTRLVIVSKLLNFSKLQIHFLRNEIIIVITAQDREL